MTGLCGDASNVYIGDRTSNKTWRAYPLPGLTTQTAYCTFTGIYATRDIAKDPDASIIWVATNYPGRSICAYNTAGQCTEIIYSSEVPEAHGLAFDSEGYLWVADRDNDKLYQLDLEAQGIEGDCTGSTAALSFSSNPFVSSLTISLDGCPDGSALEIYDLAGRLVYCGAFEGIWMWNGADGAGNTTLAGVYIVRVTGPGGFQQVASVTRI